MPSNKKTPKPIFPTSGPMRDSAKAAIDARINRLEQELDGMRALRDALPEEMSLEADEALWRLLTFRGI